MTSTKIKKMSYTGLMTALVFLATFIIRVPFGFDSGYIHLGDGMIFIASVLLGWKYGAFASGVGSALADILAGFTSWAIPTLIIKAIMGAIVGFIAESKLTKKTLLLLNGILIIIWFGFSYLVRFLLVKEVPIHADNLVQETGKSISELLSLSDRIQGQLILFIIIIPVVLILLFFLIALRKNSTSISIYTLGFIIAGIWMVFGYYIASSIIYGNYILPLFSIPLNILQFVIGIVIAQVILFSYNIFKVHKRAN